MEEISKQRNTIDEENKKKQEDKKVDSNFILQYSPRTEYSVKLEEESRKRIKFKRKF